MEKHSGKIKWILSGVAVLAGLAIIFVANFLRKLVPGGLAKLSEAIMDGTAAAHLNRDLLWITILGGLLVGAGVGYCIFSIMASRKK